MSTPDDPILTTDEPTYEVTLTFRTAASAKAFAQRLRDTQKPALPFTRKVYRVKEVFYDRDR